MKRVLLILTGLLFAPPALADVCATARPGWNGTPATALHEAMNLFLSPAGLVLLALSIIALRFRSQWIGLATIILWTGFITVVTMADPTGIRPQAMAEGCIGAPTLFIVAVAAICVAIVLYTRPRKDGSDPSET
ncbi:MAG: hypothetical protein AAFY39_00275 [Pseudomonadota bacterium]